MLLALIGAQSNIVFLKMIISDIFLKIFSTSRAKNNCVQFE